MKQQLFSKMGRREQLQRRRPAQPTRKPHLSLLPNGHVRLGGIHYHDFRAIVTAALLWTYQSDAKHQNAQLEAGSEVYPCDCYDCRNFRRRERWILETLEEALTQELERNNGRTQPEPSLKEQLQENHKLRQLVDDFLADRKEDPDVVS